MFINIAPETLWLIMGLVFILLELVIPGLIIVFFGAGALIVCVTTWLGLTTTLTAQVLTFAVASTILTGGLRWLILKFKKPEETEETTNFNIEIGRIVDVIEMIEPGQTGGKVRYQGADWSARCETKALPGDSVRITGCDNLTLIVEQLSKQ